VTAISDSKLKTPRAFQLQKERRLQVHKRANSQMRLKKFWRDN